LNIILVIDRFEDKYAILESQDKTSLIIDFPRHLLPPPQMQKKVQSLDLI